MSVGGSDYIGCVVPDGWVGPKNSGCRCHFRAFQLKLFILDIQNFGNGPVVKKLQLFETGFPLNLLAADLYIVYLFKKTLYFYIFKASYGYGVNRILGP